MTRYFANNALKPVGWVAGARLIAQSERDGRRRNQNQAANDEENAAPAEEVSDHSGKRGTEQLTGQRAGENPAHGDLTLFERDAICDKSKDDRNDAAGPGAADDTAHQQDGEGRRKGRCQIADSDKKKTCRDDTRLAEPLRHHAHDGLHDCEGEGEGGR